MQLNLDLNLRVSKRIGLTAQIIHQDNRSDDPFIPAFTEDTGIIGVDIRF